MSNTWQEMPRTMLTTLEDWALNSAARRPVSAAVRTIFRAELRACMRSPLERLMHAPVATAAVNEKIDRLCATAAQGDAVRSRHALDVLLSCLYPKD